MPRSRTEHPICSCPPNAGTRRVPVELRALLRGEHNNTQALLAPAAKAFRVIHTAIGAVDLAALGYIWACAISRQGRPAPDGIGRCVDGGGSGPRRRPRELPARSTPDEARRPGPLLRTGPTTSAAKAAVPVLTAVSVVGIALVAIRAPSENDAARPSGSIS